MSTCACARNIDGTTTPILCPMHAEIDPCETMSLITRRRRKGTIRNGKCSNCGHRRQIPKCPGCGIRTEHEVDGQECHDLQIERQAKRHGDW